MPGGLPADARRIFLAQALRAFGYGFGAGLLGVTLHQRGYSPALGVLVLAAVVAGTVVAPTCLAWFAQSVGRAPFYVPSCPGCGGGRGRRGAFAGAARGRAPAQASREVPVGDLPAVRPVRGGLPGRWFRDSGIRRVLALRAVRRADQPDRRGVLRLRATAGRLLPRGRAARPAIRAAPHNGLHPLAVERAADLGGVRALIRLGLRALAGEGKSVPDGYTGSAGVRDGSGRPG